MSVYIHCLAATYTEIHSIQYTPFRLTPFVAEYNSTFLETSTQLQYTCCAYTVFVNYINMGEEWKYSKLKWINPNNAIWKKLHKIIKKPVE